MSRKKIHKYLVWYRVQQASGWANRINSTPLADIRAVQAYIREMVYQPSMTALPSSMRTLFRDDDPYLSPVRFF